MEQIINFKNEVLALLGILCALIAQYYGGWSAGMISLLICMCIDYVTGLIVAGVFHKSSKTEDGRLESHIGWKGLVKKCVTLLLIIVGVEIDRTLGLGTFTRDALIIGFFLNEVISIVENAGLMGLPIPAILIEAIEVLKKKADIHFPNNEDKDGGEE